MQISPEVDRFCADQTSIFTVFLTEVIIILLFQQQYAPEKKTNGKVFNIMASAHFFGTI